MGRFTLDDIFGATLIAALMFGLPVLAALLA